MKQLIFLIVTFILFSCKSGNDRVKFEQPQPVSAKPLTAFGTHIQGLYINAEDSLEHIQINATEVISFANDTAHFHRSELLADSVKDLDVYDDEMVLDYLNSFGIKAEIIHDTVYCDLTKRDTLFSIGSHQILKKLNDNYFANIQSDAYWNVHLIHLEKDTLYWERIKPSDDLLKYNFAREDIEVSGETLEDSTKIYIMNPDKRGLKKLIRNGDFNISGKYVKLSKL
jgi:hypothetical protein